MGHVTVTLTITSPENKKATKAVEALVDTGATFTVLPRAVANELGLTIAGQRRVRTATGPICLDSSRAILKINGQSEVNPVLISDSIDRALVGVITLETLSLTVDPTSRELSEAEGLLF